MKILLKQFMGKNHSWAVCGWGISKALKELGYQVDIFSTDGIKNLPDSLKENVIGFTEENLSTIYGKIPDKNYDMQISYTCMKNFPHYLNNGNTNRIGIWCYEWAGKNVLPNGFAKNYKFCDVLCSPSNFAKQVFIDSGVPESRIKVIPHGINYEQYKGTSTIDLKTNKKFKILANIAQNHLRKNISGLLEAYGKAFDKNDDVCLIFKGKDKKVEQQFEVSLSEILKDFYLKYPNHAELKLFNEFIPDISALYRSVDASFTLAYSECFHFPSLEAIASGKLVISPNWGGQIDFLNNSNSLLVSGKEVRADPKSMYWESKPNAIWFQPSIDDAVDKLKYAYLNFESINKSVELERAKILEYYDWSNITKLMIKSCQE